MILFHFLGWLFWFSLPILRFRVLSPPPNSVQLLDVPDLFNRINWLIFADNIFIVIVFYINIYFLLPKVLYRNGVKRYLLYVVAIFVLQVIISFGLHYALLPDELLRTPFFLNGLSGLVFILLMSITYYLIVEKIEKERKAQEHENEKLKMELGFLRSQISPHFIFNVLNNVISLSRNQPLLVEPTLLKLSGIMRYMLYEMNHEKVSLGNEITYLNHFIDLQMQRFQDTVSVQKNFDDVDFNLKIEPLLLVPFVENAFKHGQFSQGIGCIKLNMQTAGSNLIFSAENKISDDCENEEKENGGIGLANVVRRLTLLYNDRFDLQTIRNEGSFLINLKIKLQ